MNKLIEQGMDPNTAAAMADQLTEWTGLIMV